jgi:hypothetical protein
MEQLRIDNSKRSSFVECPRKYYWKFVRNLTGEYGSTALRYGRTWHVMLHAFYLRMQKDGNRGNALNDALIYGKKEWDKMSLEQIYFEDFRTFENLCELLMTYTVQFEHDEADLKVIHTEKVFALPIPLTETEKLLYGTEFPEIIFTGKIDLQLELSGMKWVADHKTTGQSIDRMSMTLKRDPQFLGYTYASRKVLDFLPVGFLVNIAMSTARRNREGVFGKLTTDFRRVPQLYSDGDLEGWRASFIYVCSRMYWCHQNNIFPMQHDACYNFAKECTYTRLCEQNKHPEETYIEGFLEIPWDVESEGGLSDE